LARREIVIHKMEQIEFTVASLINSIVECRVTHHKGSENHRMYLELRGCWSDQIVDRMQIDKNLQIY